MSTPQAEANKTNQPSGPPPPANSTTETPSPAANSAPPFGTSRPRPFASSQSASANGPSFAGVAAASKLHENFMKNATGSRKKKGTQPNVAQAPAKSITKRSLKVKRPRESIVKFTIVLVDDTAAAHARKFFMPSIGRLCTYFRLGLVKQTELRSQATPDELQSLMVSLFSDISILVQSGLKLDDGYVLLMREEEQKKEAKGKKLHGQRGRFTPVERTGPYTFFHFETAREKLGKPTQWGNTIFIALAKDYGNIKVIEDHSSTEEHPLNGFESDSTLSSSFSVKNGGDNDKELPDIGSEKWHGRTRSDSANFKSDAGSKAESVNLGASHWEDEASILEEMPYSFIPTLFDLLVNLTDPNLTAVPESPGKEKAKTWFMHPTGNLRTQYNALQYVVEALKKSARHFKESSPSKWGTNSQWDFNKFLADAHRQIQHNFEFIMATRSLLADQEQYQKALYLTIRFGPRGLTPLITLIHSLHKALSNAVKAGVILHLTIVEAVSYLDYFGDVLYHIVCDVCNLTSRMHLDPSGLAELEYALSHPDVGVVEGYIHPDFWRRKQWSDYQGQSTRSIYKQVLSQVSSVPLYH
ncbi:hypothetical protein H0H93_013361 [Arthromyces matolae]|nr:hypothetical protein H0H93_013361 [Arthromyces matolae]